MNIEEFKKFIESIGFVIIRHNRYEYKHYIIYFDISCYYFDDGYDNTGYHLDNLAPLEKVFKNELRSIKIKNLLK